MSPPDPSYPFLPPAGFDPGAEARRFRRSAEASFEETVVNAVLRSLERPGPLKARLLDLGRLAVGRPALRLDDLKMLGYPLTLRAARVAPSSPAQVLTGFHKTPLFERWLRLDEADPDWGPPGNRCLVFHWNGWGVCGLTDRETLLDALGAYLVVSSVPPDDRLTPDLHPLYLAPLVAVVAAVGWRPGL